MSVTSKYKKKKLFRDFKPGKKTMNEYRIFLYIAIIHIYVDMYANCNY